MIELTTQEGIKLYGTLVRKYLAFEGGLRYIFDVKGDQYRCIKTSDGKFVEYVA